MYEIFKNNASVLSTYITGVAKPILCGYTGLTITMYGMCLIAQVTITAIILRGDLCVNDVITDKNVVTKIMNNSTGLQRIELRLVPAQDVHFFYTRSHLSVLQNCAVLFSTNFQIIFIFKKCTTQFSHYFV